MFICIGFSMHLSLNLELASTLNGMKMPVLGCLFLSMTLTWLIFGAKFNLPLFLFSMLFPIYFIYVSFVHKSGFSLSVSGLYLAWSIYCFLLSKLWYRTENMFLVFIRISLYVSFFIVFWGILAGLFGDGSLFVLEQRLSFGFQNPNFFAQYCQVIIISSALLVLLDDKISKKEKALLFLICGVMFIIILGAKSRNVILALLASFIVYRSFKSKYRTLINLAIVISFSAGSVFMDLKNVNSASSGRITLWGFYIVSVVEEGSESIAFGAREYPDVSKILHSYSRFKQEKNSKKDEKFHADNIYIELFVESGIIGLFLFLLAYIMVVIKANNQKIKRLWYSIMFGAIVQGFFITNFSSFFSPIAFFYGSIVLMPIYLHNTPTLKSDEKSRNE